MILPTLNDCRIFRGPKQRIPKGWHYVSEGPCPCGCVHVVIYVRAGGWQAFNEHYAMLQVDHWFGRKIELLKRRKAGVK